MTKAGFFAFLGKTLALAIVADQAYGQAAAGGAPSLLEPANFFALIQETESVFAPAPVPAALIADPVATVGPAGQNAAIQQQLAGVAAPQVV